MMIAIAAGYNICETQPALLAEENPAYQICQYDTFHTLI